MLVWAARKECYNIHLQILFFQLKLARLLRYNVLFPFRAKIYVVYNVYIASVSNVFKVSYNQLLRPIY